MSTGIRGLVVIPALALTLTIGLTGCGKLGAVGIPGPVGSGGVSSATTSAPTAIAPSASADDSAALDGISQDLGSADTANTEAGSNSDAGDQASSAGDGP